ncbi:unnamed protein product [Cylindrotheca closterium]|uniref:Arf-GAP domain-containing protein n=1 Tax=Cylindrotheca closterium TaxID=2856 RepID=A0AAD2GAL2_9STRA|nr:unnamed protein product [Cylindrotheca closterium]
MSKSHKTLTLRLSSIQNRPENKTCCECSCSNPSWASLAKSPLADAREDDRLGAFICYACSTAHKQLGESLCTVKSIAVGSWTMADVMAMERGGNDVMNQIFEATLPTESSSLKPTESSETPERCAFFNLKYGERKFYCPDTASRLILPNPSPAASSSDSPSLSGRRSALSAYRQRSLPTLSLDEHLNSSPSRSGRRGVRRVHSSDEDEWEPLSPVSIGVYSNSMSTISTKSTLFTNSSRSNRRIQFIKESPVKSSTGRLINVSLESFIESSNNLDPNNKRMRNNGLDLNTPPIMEVSDRRPSLLDEKNKDTRPKMCQRHRSERSFLAAGDLNSEEGASRRSNFSRGGRRTLSLDADQVLLEESDHKDTRPKMCRRHKSERSFAVGDLNSDAGSGSNFSKEWRAPSLDADHKDTRPKMCQRHRSERTFASTDLISEARSRSNLPKGRRTLSLDSDQNFLEQIIASEQPATAEDQQPVRRRRGSMGGRRTSPIQSLENGPVRRRGSMGGRRTASIEQQEPLCLENGPVRRRGSMGGRRVSSIERLNRRTTSIDDSQQQGKRRASLSRRNLSLDSDDIMGSPQAPRTQRRNSIESTSQRERPKYSRDLSALDTSGHPTPEAQPRAAWMEGKTPRTTGRRKSVGVESGTTTRRNSLTAGGMNGLDRSDRSLSSHGTGPSIVRRAKRNFARQGRNETKEAKGELSDSERSSNVRRTYSGDSLKNSSHHRRQGLISGDKRPSSRGLDLRNSLGVPRIRTDSDMSSSLLASTQSGRRNSNIAVLGRNQNSRSASNSDLASKLDFIDRESNGTNSSSSGNNKAPASPLTTSTRRPPRSLHVVVSADGDGDRTFVSTVTGNSSLESHWSLHKERWEA